tara:strand:+ start:1382 stop:1582 length:201 start_codon:yes stop_codon:yes gene_type:complete
MDPKDRPIDRALKEIERLNIIVTGLQREVTFLNLQINPFIISLNDKKQKEKEESSYVDVKRTGWFY